MALSSLKKNLLFSSIENKELIDAMVDDESTCTRKKPSAILELRLFDSFLTKNDQIRFWILNLYQGDTSGKILSLVFDYNSAGVNWKSRGLPVLPFVEFAINEQKYIDKYEIDKEPIEHLLKCFDSIKEILEKLKEDNFDIESTLKFTEALETLNFFILQLNNEDEKIQFESYLRFFKKYWNDLKDSTYTFRALRDISTMQKGWRNESESRYELTLCLNNLADNWPKELE